MNGLIPRRLKGRDLCLRRGQQVPRLRDFDIGPESGFRPNAGEVDDLLLGLVLIPAIGRRLWAGAAPTGFPGYFGRPGNTAARAVASAGSHLTSAASATRPTTPPTCR